MFTMDSRIGLDYIVENREYVIKLGAALDTNNVSVKKQVFELLSALCAYNADGYMRALETLDHYQNLKGTRYRLKIVVSELDAPNSPIEYQVALLSFINCLINAAQGLRDRMRIRNEFIGLKILPILTNIRRVSGSDANVAVQLDVFDEQRECDDAQNLQGPNGINLNSHLDVFYTIFGQVADTPQEIPFLSILQHLLRIDPKEAISDIIWDTAETLVHRATLLENREDSTRLLRTPSVQKFGCSHCRTDISSPNRKQSLAPVTATTHQTPVLIVSQASTDQSDSKVPKPPPIPPPLMSGNLPTMSSSSNSVPAPPPPAMPKMQRPKTPEVIDPGKLLPQQETPVPRTKMKTINWNKIPSNKLMGKNNIWTLVADSHQNSPMAELDWNEMEGLFCQQATSTQNSPKMGARDASNSNESMPGSERKSKKENSEITLLDGKRSLNINIFLKQFRTSNDEIIQLIKDGEHDDIGAEKLRGLLKILPEIDELDMLKVFDGDKHRLGNAEKFLMQLSQVPNYKLRVESMLLKEEFAANMGYLEPSINAILFAGDDLMNNVQLREVLYMVVVAGNFLNAGGYAGNAAGVKLASLQKLTDIRANKPGMNLIHFVALQAEKKNRNLLTLADNLSALENASRTTVEQITNEINALDARITKIQKQIDLPTTESDLKYQMSDFLLAAENKVQTLQRGMKEVETMRLLLTEFFCEDPNTFKLEECFKIFLNFCEKFKQAVNENERRKLQEEQATIRRKMREEQLARKARLSQAGTPVSDSDNSLMFDSSQLDIRASPAMVRRRIGSFNSSGDQGREDGFSPDITPTGSLRRRRSRVLSEEDDNSLMDFLRSSANENNFRERKTSSYGSLDRSWARRARSGTNKKRPDLLNINFNLERERPVSPANNLEVANRVVHEDARPREWRQKIESWLQANEQDERGDEHKRRTRRLTGNRRSFENDSDESRSKLDPLPEERAAVTTTVTSTTTTPSSANEPYKRVYPDWKPATSVLDKAEIEIKDDIPSTPQSKDRIINDENDTKPDRIRNSNSSTSLSSNATPLQSILEEQDRRTNQSGNETIKINVRRPSEINEYEPVYQKHSSNNAVGITSDSHSIYIRPTKKSDTLPSNPLADECEMTTNKIEIDSDNIETPPVVRKKNVSASDDKVSLSQSTKKLQAPRPLHQRTIDESLYKNEENAENETATLGDGYFDRHSSARRTRRYRRPTDHSNDSEERIDTTPESISPTNQLMYAMSNSVRSKEDVSAVRIGTDPLSKSKSMDILSRIGKHGRNMSSINQEAVREAIRKLKSPTETPERIWSPPREIIKDRAVAKVTNHELNDEGFEETQSLVSDGKDSTSSCNDQADSQQAHQVATSSSPNQVVPKTKSSMKSLLDRNRQSLARSRSLRVPLSAQIVTQQQSRNSIIIPKRTNSLRRNIDLATNSATKQDVERSGSRTSLRSSRSSLNSSASINTVRNMALKTSTTPPTSVRHMPGTDKTSFRKKLTQQQSVPMPSKTLSSTRGSSSLNSYLKTPASRSSSSGSSIGPSSRQAKTSSSNSPASNSPQRPSFRNTVSCHNTSLANQSSKSANSRLSSNLKGIASKTSNRVSSFMRPTTSSATKVNSAGNRSK